MITLRKEENYLILKIADDGCGIEADQLEKTTTLRALKQRAQRLHANLDVVSKPGEGTRLTLHIPLDSRHANAKR